MTRAHDRSLDVCWPWLIAYVEALAPYGLSQETAVELVAPYFAFLPVEDIANEVARVFAGGVSTVEPNGRPRQIAEARIAKEVADTEAAIRTAAQRAIDNAPVTLRVGPDARRIPILAHKSINPADPATRWASGKGIDAGEWTLLLADAGILGEVRDGWDELSMLGSPLIKLGAWDMTIDTTHKNRVRDCAATIGRIPDNVLRVIRGALRVDRSPMQPAQLLTLDTEEGQARAELFCDWCKPHVRKLLALADRLGTGPNGMYAAEDYENFNFVVETCVRGFGLGPGAAFSTLARIFVEHADASRFLWTKIEGFLLKQIKAYVAGGDLVSPLSMLPADTEVVEASADTWRFALKAATEGRDQISWNEAKEVLRSARLEPERWSGSHGNRLSRVMAELGFATKYLDESGKTERRFVREAA